MWTSAPGGTMDVASTRSPPITLAMSASTVVVVCTFIGDTAGACAASLDFVGVSVAGSELPHATVSNTNMTAGRKMRPVRCKPNRIFWDCPSLTTWCINNCHN